jgi:hypothetical protein
MMNLIKNIAKKFFGSRGNKTSVSVDPDFEPCWYCGRQMKYCVWYDHASGRWNTTFRQAQDVAGAYVSTQEQADQVVEYLNSQEIK